MATVTFQTNLFKINSKTILRLPEEVSVQLPSRGMVMVEGTINKIPFKTVLEPDGRYGPGVMSSHWFSPDNKLLKMAQVRAGESVDVKLAVTKDWINPEIPQDMKKAIVADHKIHRFWNDEITPMAKWDWVRWVRAVKTKETRQRHIDVMMDKLRKGMRRPCCFNRNLCSDPTVSQNWVLLNP